MLLEIPILLSHIALPRIGHLQAVYHILVYLKQVQERNLYFDPVSPLIRKDSLHQFDWEDFYHDSKEAIPDDMPKQRGKITTTHFFVDANHAADKVTRCLQTGILIL